jgi:endonuclease III
MRPEQLRWTTAGDRQASPVASIRDPLTGLAVDPPGMSPTFVGTMFIYFGRHCCVGRVPSSSACQLVDLM